MHMYAHKSCAYFSDLFGATAFALHSVFVASHTCTAVPEQKSETVSLIVLSLLSAFSCALL